MVNASSYRQNPFCSWSGTRLRSRSSPRCSTLNLVGLIFLTNRLPGSSDWLDNRKPLLAYGPLRDGPLSPPISNMFSREDALTSQPRTSEPRPFTPLPPGLFFGPFVASALPPIFFPHFPKPGGVLRVKSGSCEQAETYRIPVHPSPLSLPSAHLPITSFTPLDTICMLSSDDISSDAHSTFRPSAARKARVMCFDKWAFQRT